MGGVDRKRPARAAYEGVLAGLTNGRLAGAVYRTELIPRRRNSHFLPSVRIGHLPLLTVKEA
jgi:hypothetical protein